MSSAIQGFAAVLFIAAGLSHLLQPQAWIAFFAMLARVGVPAALAEGFLYLTFGGLIVAFHPVWHGPAAVLTVLGWAQVIKGLARFLAPQRALAAYEGVRPEHAWKFRAVGALALLLGLLFAALALQLV